MKTVMQFRRFIILVLLLLAGTISMSAQSSITQRGQGVELSMDLQEAKLNRVVDGNRYLFGDNWNQVANINLLDGSTQVFYNVNIDGFQKQLHYKDFEGTKMILFNNVKDFTINKTKYINVYYNDDNAIFEVVAEGFYKGFEAEIIPASSNPMVNRPTDQYLFKTIYIVENENGYKRVSKRKFNKALQLVK